MIMPRTVFITGGTGYLGRFLIPELLKRGHTVRALVRPGSEKKILSGCAVIAGDPLKQESFAAHIAPADTLVQLVGVPHPNPAKAEQFKTVDLVSVRESVVAAKVAGIRHFIYVSMAQPAPVMKVYQEVRAEGERLIRASGMNATLLRPLYILGPGHWWPYLVLPGFWLAELIPATRESARRLGLVTLRQMIVALVAAVENQPAGVKLLEVPEIRAAAEGVMSKE